MKIAVIGAGNVGSTLAKKWAAQGHKILLGVRAPAESKSQDLLKSIGAGASAHTITEAAAAAEVIVLATPWDVSEAIARQISEEVKGKVLIDCTNPLKKDLSGLEVGHSSSGGELIQKSCPQAFVYKAFNTTGFNIMADPHLESRKTAMFFCGDDQTRREVVAGLVREVGFESIDAGPLASARLLEPFAMLWIQSAYRFGLGRDFSFGILRRM